MESGKALHDPVTYCIFALQRTQKVQDTLLLRWRERVEVVDHMVGFRAAISPKVLIAEPVVRSLTASAASVSLDGLQ